MINSKNIFYLLSLFLMMQTSLFGANIQNTSVNTPPKKVYYMGVSHRPSIVDFLYILQNKTHKNKYGRKFQFPRGKVLCGRLYTENLGGGNKQQIHYNFIALNYFNFATGNYKCSYHLRNGKIITARSYIPYWQSLIGGSSNHREVAFNYLDGLYKPDNIDKIYSPEYSRLINRNSANNSFDIYKTAKKLGIYNVGKFKTNDKTITFSQFVVNLITLNSSYVTGVNPFGQIIINPAIKNKLTFINNKKNTEGFFGETISFFEKMFRTHHHNETNQLVLNNLKTFSPIQYFSKKLFGLYYNFMDIAWGSIFQYAGTLFLMFLALYSGGFIALKYGMHKLKHENTRGEFDFPIKERLVSVGMTLMLSFIPFPTGNGTVVIKGEKPVVPQTTIAKEVISYMADVGTKIADYSAGNVMTAYMAYVLSSSDSYSEKNIKTMANRLGQNIRKEKLRSNFFQSVCVDGYPYKKEDFSQMIGVNYSALWQPTKSTTIKQSIFAGNTKQIENSRPTLNYCASLERTIVISNANMKQQKGIVENAIRRMLKSGGNTSSASADFFALTQLESAKRLGWFSVASIPILQVFLKDSNIINFAGAAISESGQNNGIERAELNTGAFAANQSSNKKIAAVGETATHSHSYLHGAMLDVLSEQVYFMMPMFSDVYKTSKDMVWQLANIAQDIPFFKVGSFFTSVFKKLKRLKKRKGGVGKSPLIMSGIVAILAFFIAVVLYKLMIEIVFAAVVSLLIVVKIALYLLDIFVYFFVSPFIVAWQMTINNNTDRLHKYITNGFVLLVVRPSLIVFSTIMFVVALGLIRSIYNMLFDTILSSVSIAEKLMGGFNFHNMHRSIEGSVSALLITANLKGVGSIFIDIISLFIAYKIIMEGDKMMLDRFGYKDENESTHGNQIAEKVQTLAGKI